MSTVACPDPDCQACVIRRILQHCKDEGAPAEYVTELLFIILGEVYEDVHFEQIVVDDTPGSLH